VKIYKRVLIFAVLIGLLTVYGLNRYISSLSTTVSAPTVSYSKVVAAANAIPANVKITAEMVTLKSVPLESVHPEAVTALDKVIGTVSNSDIVKDEQILSSRIVTDTSKATLAYRVPQDMRAVAIPSSEISGVAGYINTGDKIDILVTYDKKDINPVSTTYTQLQDIEVAAVGTAVLSEADKKKALPASITVFVKPAQAEVLAYAVANGSLFFSLRNPVDSQRAGLKYYNSTNFSTYSER
jgi:pilus assembly protein CpaB